METKKAPESPLDQSSSTSPSRYWVLQQISEEALRVAGEALNVFDPSIPHQQEPRPASHRRSHSDVLMAGSRGHKRSSSFQRLKTHMQKAWKWGGNTRVEGYAPSFNPEIFVDQKRQWYQLHSKALDKARYKVPTALFEHFFVVGIHHNANLSAVEDAFAVRKKWELEMENSEESYFNIRHNKIPCFPTMEPQVLFKYPPGKRVSVRLKDLASFCFPAGVKTRLPERTPSLSDLNELIYGQGHMGTDNSAFVFSLRMGDSDTLYGVCLHVNEIVQRPPGVSGLSSPISQPILSCSRFLVSAPRCYCLLTRVPFFELHFEVLNRIIAQERLNRIKECVTGISLTSLSPSKSQQETEVQRNSLWNITDNSLDWKHYAIPIDSAAILAAAAATEIIPADNIPTASPKSPESVTVSEASDSSQSREMEADYRKDIQLGHDCPLESSESRSESLDRICGGHENSSFSPETGWSRNLKLERLASFDALFSPVRSTVSEDEGDDFFLNHEIDYEDNFIMEWASESKHDLLHIVSSYHALIIPERGEKIIFQPLPHLQEIEYNRTLVSDLLISEKLCSCESTELNAMLAAAEESHALSIWTTATLCRVLSLESVLALFAGMLLEKQVVVVCSNLGVLSAIVLSVIPMIQPCQWQNLLLPILPSRMADFLDAPVPFVVGIPNKPADLKLRSSNLVHVNVQKDQVKTCQLPTLPRYKDLVSDLRPSHTRLSLQSSEARKRPIFKCDEEQIEAATEFLNITRCYVESLCSDLRSHTITNVQSNNDRVSLLLKDSFVDSFPCKDKPFIKLFVDTQQFALLSDCRLSTFESQKL